jgi:sec-independent protein translocase protein TatA
MLNIGPQELLLILVIALLVVGPRRLPELGRSVGRGIRELRKAQDEVRKTIQVSIDDDQGRPAFDEHRRDARRGTNERTSGEGDESAKGPVTGDETREISRTLGRGLAELRKARAEVERSFRVDMDAPRPAGRATKADTTPSGASGQAASTGPSEPDAGGSGERSAPE